MESGDTVISHELAPEWQSTPSFMTCDAIISPLPERRAVMRKAGVDDMGSGISSDFIVKDNVSASVVQIQKLHSGFNR